MATKLKVITTAQSAKTGGFWALLGQTFTKKVGGKEFELTDNEGAKYFANLVDSEVTSNPFKAGMVMEFTPAELAKLNKLD